MTHIHSEVILFVKRTVLLDKYGPKVRSTLSTQCNLMQTYPVSAVFVRITTLSCRTFHPGYIGRNNTAHNSSNFCNQLWYACSINLIFLWYIQSGIYYDGEVPCCLNPKNTDRYLETSVLAQFGFTIEQLQSLYTIDLRLLVLAAERGGREGGREGLRERGMSNRLHPCQL